MAIDIAQSAVTWMNRLFVSNVERRCSDLPLCIHWYRYSNVKTRALYRFLKWEYFVYDLCRSTVKIVDWVLSYSESDAKQTLWVDIWTKTDVRLDSSKMELVQKKYASKTAGDFVFDLQPKIVRGASRMTGFSSIQTDILRLNAEHGNKISLEIQLKGLSALIQLSLKRSSHIGHDVISAYHDRSLVLYHLERFDKCIIDASFIIEKCPYYSNAYMIRSRALLQLNRLYEAYDDIMQACILEKFAEKDINAMLSIIVKRIGEHWILSKLRNSFTYFRRRWILVTESSSEVDHGGKSFEAYKKSYKFPASQWLETLLLWKATNNYILTKFPNPFQDDHPIGFRSAINALHRNEYSKIASACKVEIVLNGEYANESRLLRAQIHHLVLPLGPTTKQLLIEDYQELKKIVKAEQPLDEDLVFEAKLLICRIVFALQNYDKKSEKSSLYATFANKLVAKRNGIAQFWQGYDLCATLEKPDLVSGLKLLKRSSDSMGIDFFVAPFYLAVFILTMDRSECSSKTSTKPVEQYVLRLGNLHTRFPNEIQPLKLLINYYIQTKSYNLAAMYVQTLAKLLPPTNSIAPQIEVNATHDSDRELIIRHLKSVIRDDPEEFAAYDALIDIYAEQTYEYAKCLEVLSKALAEISDRRLYRQLFQRRQKLLFSIVAANFWPELWWCLTNHCRFQNWDNLFHIILSLFCFIFNKENEKLFHKNK